MLLDACVGWVSSTAVRQLAQDVPSRDGSARSWPSRRCRTGPDVVVGAHPRARSGTRTRRCPRPPDSTSIGSSNSTQRRGRRPTSSNEWIEPLRIGTPEVRVVSGETWFTTERMTAPCVATTTRLRRAVPRAIASEGRQHPARGARRGSRDRAPRRRGKPRLDLARRSAPRPRRSARSTTPGTISGSARPSRSAMIEPVSSARDSGLATTASNRRRASSVAGLAAWRRPCRSGGCRWSPGCVARGSSRSRRGGRGRTASSVVLRSARPAPRDASTRRPGARPGPSGSPTCRHPA